jgi:steroid delta-isomerase-like uncharacterized protein
MSTKENKAIVRRMTEEVLCGGNFALMDELVAPDFVNHNLLATGEASHSVGVESYRREAMEFRSVFPDITVTIIHLLADGDKVIAHGQYRGTHKGELMGIPATGKKVEWSGISIIRIANGKIAERWNIADRYVLLQQLGVIPAPGQTRG